MQTLRFIHGDEMPAVGLGTWKSEPGEMGRVVREAIGLGFRHLDCAPAYGNEREIGQAMTGLIAEGRVGREALWITSKLWNDAHAPADVRPALTETLQDLQVEYLDLFLIHWPVAWRRDVSFPERGEQFR